MTLKLSGTGRPPAITDFLTEWRDDYTCETPFGSERTFGLCLLEVEDFAGAVWLKSIRTMDPGKGHATRAVEALCFLADRHNVAIILYPKPFGAGPTMSTRNLKLWYARFGFKLMRNGSMRRTPTTHEGVIKLCGFSNS